ncbi:putative choline transporter, neither null mutation nor overexpression affects choline transport [Agyrium rufum]|nr:putative choline transporter, neither null mutation nor overexpression affects choline transport [Agyrium rufum]
MAHHGQADDYYKGENGNQEPQYQMGNYKNQPNQGYQQSNPGYRQEYQQGYPPPNSGAPYTQPPPGYGGPNGNQGPPQAPQPMYQDGSGGKPTFEQTFKLDKPKYNDLWAGILLILVFLGFAAVSGISINGYQTNKLFNGGGIYNSDNTFSLNTNTIVLFAFVLVVAFVLSWGYFLAARAFTKQFIWITGILQIVFGFGTAVYYLVRGYYSAGIVFALFAVFSVVCFISWIPRIPFSVLMLQTTMDVARHHGHVFMVAATGGLVALAFGAWYSVTLAAIYVKYEPNANGTNPACGSSCSSGKVIGLIVFVTFAGYWITEWLKNTIYSTIAGVYGSWYFCAGKPGGVPSGATRGAFKRSMTYSFGSISFGSLIVAIINMLRQAISIAQSSEAAQGNQFAACLFCLLGCLVGIIDWAVSFLNRYAFSHIALYGKAYIPAAKDTWTMMKSRGIDALVNDCLISPVLTMGSTFVGFICALLAFLYLEFTKPAYNTGGSFTPIVLAISFLIGLQVCQIFMTPIGSGVDTFFVAAAWDPEVLRNEHPQLWAEMVRVYPKVQQAIHV